MPLKLTYSKLRDQRFPQAFSKLVSATPKNTKAGYNLMRILKAIEQESHTAQELFIKLVKEHAVLDEKGEIKPVAGRGPGSFDIRPEMQQSWEAKQKEHEAFEIVVERYPVKLDDFEWKAPLTAIDMLALEPLLDLPAD